MLDRAMGFEVRPPYNHMLAKGRWTTGTAAKPSNFEPKFDYEKAIATVAVRTDQRLQVTADMPYKTWDGEEPGVASAKRTRLGSRVLQITVQDAELWYCVPNTVTDVREGKLVKRNGDATAVDPAAGLLLRDDGARLRQIAALAKAWYGKVRAAVSVPFQSVEFGYRVGSYVAAVQDTWRYEPINSVVTEKVFTFGEDELTTLVRTNYTELDSTFADTARGAAGLGR
jgi:hypothetical protein